MSGRRKILIVALIILFFIAAAVLVINRQFLRPTASILPESSLRADDPKINTVASKLKTPWDIAFLPDGDMLVTERSGTVKRIGSAGTYPVEGVTETSEGGLLGIALHPDFSNNTHVYLYSTYQENGTLLNRVERYTYNANSLVFNKLIIGGIPGASNHDGGALAFGPDGKLYIGTGDAGNESSAQETSALSGKILRLNDDGSVPADNPFGNAVYSYGHRNPQGIAWDDEGRMWAVEHGPSGSASGRDELNRIDKGGNYGWPVITGDETRENMHPPVAQSGDNDTWAPSGLAFADGALYFAGLRGQTLYQATINDEGSAVSLTRHFAGEYGRLRAVQAHQQYLYISTSNTDGRGSPRTDDDKIIRITTSLF